MDHHIVSLHQVKIYECVVQHDGWITNKAITEDTGMPARTVRHHTRLLTHLGIFAQEAFFPNYIYRLSAQAAATNPAYLTRLEHAREIFGEGAA